MKRKKVRVSILVISLFAAIIFSGCKNSLPRENASKDADENTEPYTVLIYAPLYASEEACNRVSAKISEITMKEIGCQVKLKRNMSAYQLNQAMASEETMDLFPCFTWEFSLAEFVARNKIIQMDDLLSNYGVEMKNSISEEDWECTIVDGHIYGVPMNKDKAQGRCFLMVKDIADELQIDYSRPMDYQDLELVFQKVKAAYPDMYPIVPSDGSIINPVWDVDMLGDGLGVLENCLTDSTEVVNLYNCASFKKYCSYMYRWVQLGYMMPDAINTIESSNDLIRNGIGFGTFAPYKEGIEYEESRNKGKQIAAIELAQPHSTTDMVSSCWVISSKSKEPQKAMQVLNLMYTNSEVANLLVNGTENENWIYEDKTRDIIRFPEGVGQSNTDYSVYGWIWPNEQITSIWSGQDADYWDKLDRFNKNAKASPAKGFIWKPENVQREAAACRDIVDKYYNGLILGCLNPDEAIPKFNDELEKAGINTIINEKQRQLDVWLSKQ